MSPSNRTAACFLVLAWCAAAQTPSQPLIGKGWGLDHVIVAQRSAAAARETHAIRLGFSVVSGNRFPDLGLENGLILLPPAYLELLWIYDLEKASAAAQASGAQQPLITNMLRVGRDQGGLILSYNVDVSPIEDAAAFLGTLGKKVTLPPSVTTLRDGKQQPGAWQFLTIEKDPSAPVGVPGGLGVGFLEYRDNSDERLRQRWETIEKDNPDDRLKPGDLHANTARKLNAIWIAVLNVEEAVKRAQSFGFAPGRERKLSVLGAAGREVACGQGQIVFWRASNDDSPLAAAVRRQGLGPFGVSVGVSDLNRAHEIVEQGTGKHFQIDRSGAQPTFLVSPDDAGGIWIEFVQL
jgi:hypothetical protein